MKYSFLNYHFLFLLYLSFSVCNSQNNSTNQNIYRLQVSVSNSEDNNPLRDVTVLIDQINSGGITDKNGDYIIEMYEGEYDLTISYLGFSEVKKSLYLNKDLKLEILMEESKEELSEVIVNAINLNDNVESPQMGVFKLATRDLIKIPSGLGEFDVLRGMTLLAGVNNAGDVSNGISVRGGSLDQNLMLYDQAPVFNPTHLFGLFSVFTPDVISGVDMYQANIPSKFGGRMASVLDIKVKNPYTDKLKLEGGVGLVSSRLTVTTPIIKDKLLMIAGGRAGFTDFLFPMFSKKLENTKANFIDNTIKLLYLPSENDQISFTHFYTTDFYKLDLITNIENISSSDNSYDFSTFNQTLSWIRSISEKAFIKTTFVNSNYSPKTLFKESEANNTITFQSQINFSKINSEYSKKVNEKLDYYIGIQANRYNINPGSLDPGNGNSINPVNLNDEISYELSGYSNVNFNPSENISLSLGLRYTNFYLNGPYTKNEYDTDGLIIGSQLFGEGEKVQSYSGIEPRFGASLKLSDDSSIKISYAKINQYIQNIYNSTTPLPTSRWKTSDPFILPQSNNTYGLGLFKNLNSKFELSIEGYYRSTENNLTYKPGADFFLEQYLENDVIQIDGRAYGIEFSLKKPSGRINGWMNYTWAKSLLKSNGNSISQTINSNQWYDSEFDRPHTFNGTINFETDKFNTWSFNFTAQSGRPYTVANGVFEINDKSVPIFLERNNARLPFYHRLDFSWKVAYNKDDYDRWRGDWTLTIYNLYGAKNPLNRYYTEKNGSQFGNFFGKSPLGSFNLSVVNSVFVSISYNFKFQ